MAGKWEEHLSDATTGLRVAVCQPINSERLFLDVRRTYIWEDRERLSDEGLRVRIRDLPALEELLNRILSGETMTGTANGLTLSRRGAFLRLRRVGLGGETLKIFPAQVVFLRKVLQEFGPAVEGLQKKMAEEEEDGDKAWAEFENC